MWIRKPGKRKKGVVGVVVAIPCSAFSTAAMPSSISLKALLCGIRCRSKCVQVWCPMVCPSAAMPPDHRGMFGGRLADHEERRAHAFPGERRQHLWRRRRPRSVVEGQHDLVIPERQRLRKVFRADLRERDGIDLQDARGAERPLARTILRHARSAIHASEISKCRANRAGRSAGRFEPAHIWHCACCYLLGIACRHSSDELNPSVKPARCTMAEPLDLAPSADASVLDRLPMRNEDGEIRPEFVEEIARCIKAQDAPFLREVVAELHEADLGDLIEALDAGGPRPRSSS